MVITWNVRCYTDVLNIASLTAMWKIQFYFSIFLQKHWWIKVRLELNICMQCVCISIRFVKISLPKANMAWRIEFTAKSLKSLRKILQTNAKGILSLASFTCTVIKKKKSVWSRKRETNSNYIFLHLFITIGTTWMCDGYCTRWGWVFVG